MQIQLRRAKNLLRHAAYGCAVLGSFILTSCGSGSSTPASNESTTPASPADAHAFNLSAVNVAASDLVVHYNFDQDLGTTVLDQSGNGYDGASMPWDIDDENGTQFADGQHGHALLFSEGGRVTIDADANLDNALASNGISISLWFRLTDTTVNGYVRLVSKKPEWTQAEGFELDFNPTNRQMHLVCQGANFIEGIVPIANIDEEWHHVIATLDGNTGSIVFDGVDITSIDTVPLSGILSCPHQLTIGALANGSAAPVAPFQGVIDDLRIYNRPLSFTEQQQLYVDSQDPGSSNELVAWWTMDDSGTTITDSSGFNHHGTATDMVSGTGFINGAYFGDSVDDRINVGGSESLAIQNEMSISAWVQVTDPDQDHYMRIVSKKVEDADLGGFEFAYYPNGDNLIFNGQGLAAANVNVELGSGWNFLTVCVDGTNVQFYRNGALIGNGSITGLLQSDTPVYLGHRAREDAALPGAWFGGLDDVRLYNYALDATAIANIYAETLRVPENPSSTYAGLLYEYFEGTGWSVLPDFDSLSPLAINPIANFDISPRMRDSDFGFRFSGFVEILEHGEYTFYTSSDDGSQLYIGSTLVVDNDGLHSNRKRSGTIRLQAGKHAITGLFFERGGYEIFDVTWSGPGFSEMALPDARLFRDGGTDFPPLVNVSVAGDITATISGVSVLADATVSDSEDGALPASDIVWTSDLDGTLGTGLQIDLATLSEGDHVITVTATDSQSQSSSDSFSMSVWPASSLHDPVTPGTVINGLDYTYFEGAWSILPDFTALTPDLIGISNLPDLSDRLVEDDYGFVYSGYLLIPSDGVYTFGLNSDDGSRLIIGSTTVVNNDGLHGSILRTGSIGLKAGYHAIEIQFFEHTGSAVLDLQWTGPSISTQSIPAAQYYRLDTNHLPLVTITTPAKISSAEPDTLITFAGNATDVEDASFLDSQYSWSSNLDGFLSDGPSFNTDTLSDGVHTITLSVTDSDSAVGTASVTLFINEMETGSINREVWTDIGGVRLSDLTNHANYPDSPDIEDTLSSFEGPVNWANNYGTRLRGYIHAPVTGAYTFWVSSDDYSELYLSTDADPANKVKIAEVPGWTNSRQWNKYSQQQSVTINLVAGEHYYIEALQKEGGGGDSIAASWSFPGQSQVIIDGAYLSPFIPNINN